MIQATTTYRGAAAEAVMESVATPVETKVNGVDKLLYMQSFNANDGKMTLNVYFDVGTDVDIMQVNTRFCVLTCMMSTSVPTSCRSTRRTA